MVDHWSPLDLQRPVRPWLAGPARRKESGQIPQKLKFPFRILRQGQALCRGGFWQKADTKEYPSKN